MRNLFLRTHRLRHGLGDLSLGTGWEDTLTDALGFYLASDAQALEAFVELLLGSQAERVVNVETQFAQGSERPDMVFTLESGRLLLVENKTGAALQNRQLQRYLAMRDGEGRAARVALIAMRPRAIPAEVLGAPGYLRPRSADHFLWQDVYTCIPAGDEREVGIQFLRGAMRIYMESLGLAPSRLEGRWKLLFEPRSDHTRPVMQEFGRSLRGVRTILREAGLKVTAVSHMGLQARFPEAGALQHLTVLPSRPRLEHRTWPPEADVGHETLRIALTWPSKASDEDALAVFNRAPRPFIGASGRPWWPTHPYRFSHKRLRLDFVTNLPTLLEEERYTQEALTAACSDLIGWLRSEVE